MVAVASSADVLSRRVRYFVKKERTEDVRLARLLDEIEAPAYLFGGVVRDLALYGKRGLAERGGDIDIVCAARGCAAGPLFSRLRREDGVFRNQFGGFRLVTRRWNVDLWAAEDTWAFREGKFDYESVESLLETTITNWEAVLARVDGGRLMYKDGYFRDLQEGYLDVVFSENPNLLGMYVRLVRACIERPVRQLSEKASRVVRGALDACSLGDMMSYEREHYRRCYIDGAGYRRVSSAVAAPEGGAVVIERAEETANLFR